MFENYEYIKRLGELEGRIAAVKEYLKSGSSVWANRETILAMLGEEVEGNDEDA